MEGSQKIRHCEKCDTQVHDLTGLSADEILTLKDKNGGKLCGAFRMMPSVRRPLVLGSGIASLALASCAREEEIELMGVICEPPAKEEPAKKKVSQQGGAASAAAKPIDTEDKEDQPVEVLEIQPNPPVLMGKICPRQDPEPKRGNGPV